MGQIEKADKDHRKAWIDMFQSVFNPAELADDGMRNAYYDQLEILKTDNIDQMSINGMFKVIQEIKSNTETKVKQEKEKKREEIKQSLQESLDDIEGLKWDF